MGMQVLIRILSDDIRKSEISMLGELFDDFGEARHPLPHDGESGYG